LLTSLTVTTGKVQNADMRAVESWGKIETVIETHVC